MGYSSKQKQLQSSNEIFLKAAVAVAVFVALVSLGLAVLSHIEVKSLETKVEKCMLVTNMDRATREESGLVDNRELKALAGEMAEIRSKVKELINNASITHSDLKSIVEDIQEEIIIVRKAEGIVLLLILFIVPIVFCLTLSCHLIFEILEGHQFA